MKVFKSVKHWIKWNIATPVCHLLGIVAPTDWINAGYFMAKKILPYLKQFKKKEKRGYPVFFLMEPYRSEITEKGYTFNSNTQCFSDTIIENKSAEDYIAQLWDAMLDEMIFAIEQTVNESDESYMVPNPDYNPDQKNFCEFVSYENDKELSEMEINKDYGKLMIDSEKYGAYNERIQKGLELMGKHWQSLWD